MMLTEHFSERELGVEGATEREVKNARWLCEQVLEPVRAKFGRALVVHCGRRSEEHNRAVGGKSASWHLYEEMKAAADFHVEGVALHDVFAWLHASELPYDRIILESSGGEARCVHVQAERGALAGRVKRLAFVGGTGACASYVKV